MKKLLFSLTLVTVAIGFCRAAIVDLTGTLGTQTLTTANCYYLKGCAVVPNGVVLTINPGVVIRCEAASSLIITRGGQIFSNGTATNPVVFTSDQPVGSRAPGDWAGIVVNGFANNNVVNGGGGDIPIVRCGNTYNGGGTNDADNSGVIQFTRIEFAGGGSSGDTEIHGLVLNSIGTGTQIHDVQVSESAQDAFLIAGGKAEMSRLFSLNAYRNDFYFTHGNQSKVQFGLALRMDVNAHVGTPIFSNGMIIENNPTANANIPNTLPLISNFTLLDPSYCSRTISTDLKNGILIRNNGKANIRNSVVSQFGDYGFFIQDAASVSNTAANTLNFSYNALLAKSPFNYGTGASWATGCGGSLSSMTSWINGTGLVSCRESNNSFTLTSFGYNSSICNNYCNMAPTFTYSGSSLNTTDFSAPFNTFFSSTTYKGAIGSTDWSSGWAIGCPQNQTYCSVGSLRAGKLTPIQFSPNPGSSMVTARFEAIGTGTAQLNLSDRITGQVLRSVQSRITAPGAQDIRFSVQGLRAGIYPVSIRLNGQVNYGQLVVK